MSPFNSLLKSLSIANCDEALIKQALTHRSVGNFNNERLEFVGDAVLGFVIADILYQRFPEASEGELSRMRSSLVKKEALAALARQYEIGTYLHLGSGELKSGGFSRDSILADALEAIIGAVYFSEGYPAVRDFLVSLYQHNIETLDGNSRQKDAKTRLQEWLQAKQMSLPVYEVVDIQGKDHAQKFIVECRVTELDVLVTATGTSRRKAEQSGAQLMLDKIYE